MTARSTARHGGDAGVRLDAQDGVALGIDRIDGAGETALGQVFEDGAAHAAGISVAPMTAMDGGEKMGTAGGACYDAEYRGPIRWSWNS